MPATQFFLTIEHDRLVVKFDGTHGGKSTRVVTSVGDLAQFLVSKAHEAGVEFDDLAILASSSIDFPHEFTDRPETIALAKALCDDERG